MKTVRQAQDFTCPLLKRKCETVMCMMWRWNPKQPTGEYDSEYGPKRPSKREGFCGLAGREGA
jgi:hypothetical protein